MTLKATAKPYHAGGIVVGLEGELDLATGPQLDTFIEALEMRPERLVLDLSGLEFCDAAGLKALLAVERKLAVHGVDLILGNPQRMVARVLALTGLNRHFTITPTSCQQGDETPP